MEMEYLLNAKSLIIQIIQKYKYHIIYGCLTPTQKVLDLHLMSTVYL